jgi:hypothetical protein
MAFAGMMMVSPAITTNEADEAAMPSTRVVTLPV